LLARLIHPELFVSASNDLANFYRPVDVSLLKGQLTEGRDYYLESGRMVFTANYLKRRGYCCGSGCRHCPYE
jgi:hypothetical protein